MINHRRLLCFAREQSDEADREIESGMKLLRGFNDTAGYRDGFLSIGNFDGVHRGHQQMFAALTRRARMAAVPSVVLTFDPHPIQLLRPEQVPPALTSLDQKIALIEACGVDFLIVYPTDLRMLNLSAEDFFERVVLGEFQARGLVEGPNFFFGRDRGGNTQLLERLCLAAGLELDIVPPVFAGTLMVSSSAIRQLLLDGDVAQAADLLGHWYQVYGQVSLGAERGRTIGFPTANVTHITTLLPRDGVYAGIARTEHGRWPAAINLGPNPTFGEKRRKLEAHLLGFQGDLYGRPIEIDFVERIRDTQPFVDLEALKRQIHLDVERVRDVVRV